MQKDPLKIIEVKQWRIYNVSLKFLGSKKKEKKKSGSKIIIKPKFLTTQGNDSKRGSWSKML